jgi:hypothetical protein
MGACGEQAPWLPEAVFLQMWARSYFLPYGAPSLGLGC